MRSACSRDRLSALSSNLVKPARSRPSAAASSARLVATGCTSCGILGLDRRRGSAAACAARDGLGREEQLGEPELGFLRRRRICDGDVRRLSARRSSPAAGRGRVAPGRDDRRVRPAEVAHDRVEIRGGERLAMTQDRLGDLDHVAREAPRDRRRRARIARDLLRDRRRGSADRPSRSGAAPARYSGALPRPSAPASARRDRSARAPASGGYRRRRAARGRRGPQAWEKSPSRNPPARSADTNSRGATYADPVRSMIEQATASAVRRGARIGFSTVFPFGR